MKNACNDKYVFVSQSGRRFNWTTWRIRMRNEKCVEWKPYVSTVDCRVGSLYRPKNEFKQMKMKCLNSNVNCDILNTFMCLGYGGMGMGNGWVSECLFVYLFVYVCVACRGFRFTHDNQSIFFSSLPSIAILFFRFLILAIRRHGGFVHRTQIKSTLFSLAWHSSRDDSHYVIGDGRWIFFFHFLEFVKLK